MNTYYIYLARRIEDIEHPEHNETDIYGMPINPSMSTEEKTVLSSLLIKAGISKGERILYVG